MQAVTVSHSPLGKKLKQTINLQLPENKSLAEQKLQRYIIDSLCWKMAALVPFTFDNQSTMQIAKHLQRHRTASPGTLYQYIHAVHRFSNWANITPDQLIKECQDQDGDPNHKALAKYSRLLDDYLGELQAEGYAPGTVSNNIKGVKALFQANRLRLDVDFNLSKRVIYKDRAPRADELANLIDLSELRVKVIVSMLALGGFRIGTLTKLKYRHVKQDLERNVTPIHVHVESEITKGKYHDYDTFLAQEASDYLRAYIEIRKRGTEKIPPESITDDSPLIRNAQRKEVIPVTPASIHKLVHDQYVKAGILGAKPTIGGRYYELRVHSIRKFFRTQLASLGVQTDYVEYMMGHTISTYHDIEMKGIDFLRGIYASAGFGIKPKTRLSKIDALKEIIRAWGLNPEEILTRDAQTKPNVTTYGREQIEELQLHNLSQALKKQIVNDVKGDLK